MKGSDAWPSASRSLQAEFGVMDISVIPAYPPYTQASDLEAAARKRTPILKISWIWA